MAYRKDPDLNFLAQVTSEDLDHLVHILTRDSDGEVRYTQTLSNSDKYQKHFPDHKEYWSEIAEELQCFGGNTVANIFRLGDGVLYNEIIEDVCDALDAEAPSGATTWDLENAMLCKLLSDSLGKMDLNDLHALANELGIKNVAGYAGGPVVTAAILAAFRAGGFQAYQLSVVIANAVAKAIFGSGLTIAANAGLTRVLAIATGPVGWVITALWTVGSVVGSPALRVTVPASVYVAMLRRKYSCRGIQA